MTAYLVRHADAGGRSRDAHDRYRPLTPSGRVRADGIADELGSAPIVAVFSSPATRCVQTVEPLARRLGLTVDEAPELWEDADGSAFVEFIGERAVGDVVFCSHGNLIPIYIDRLIVAEVPVVGRGIEKGSIWEIHTRGDWIVGATYHHPS